MKLKFRFEYKSIKKFKDIELSNFTLLTGINGVGKSHLLEAIEGKQAIQGIQVIIEGEENSNIVFFNYETFRLENESAFNSQQIESEKISAWNWFKNVKNQIMQYRNILGEDYLNYKKEAQVNNKRFFEVIEKKNTPQCTQYILNIENLFQNYIKQNQQFASSVFALIKSLDYSMDEITEDEFKNIYKPYQFKNSFLPTLLGRIIWDYYLKYEENEFNKYRNEKRGDTLSTLNDEEFLKKHGEKPWIILNQILSTFKNLDYKIEEPTNKRNANYSLQLVHKVKDIKINFQDLSSGEKILMALVASIYKTQTDNFFPNILLLDELDATLHPSMVKHLLHVIKEIFLKNGVKVILVTHSPTTVALSDEESIFIMNKEGENRIEKSSKDRALKILTEGIPTLSINYENRKQVFVESKYDKEYYDKIYQILISKKLNPEISLSFIASGDSKI